MALTDILNKITEEADRKAGLMKQATDDEIQRIKEETQTKIDARKAEILEKVKEQSASVIEKSKTLAGMAGRSKTLEEKRAVIDQAYDEVLKELNHLDSHDYSKLLTQMIEVAMKEVPKGNLIVPEGRTKVTETAVGKAGADYHVKDETRDFKGGFILTSGKLEVNFSFYYLVQKVVRPATELEVAQILFP